MQMIVNPKTVIVMSSSTKYEIKSCPRCGTKFECKPGNITQCQCYSVSLTKDESVFIKEIYDECLCAKCLFKMKNLFKEKVTLEYYSTLKKELRKF
jgi:hypothetical protein